MNVFYNDIIKHFLIKNNYSYIEEIIDENKEYYGKNFILSGKIDENIFKNMKNFDDINYNESIVLDEGLISGVSLADIDGMNFFSILLDNIAKKTLGLENDIVYGNKNTNLKNLIFEYKPKFIV